jgi:hypothetical protein
MARRGGQAAAEDTGGSNDLTSEVEALDSSESRFSDPVRESPATTEEPAQPPPQPSAPPSAPGVPGGVSTGPQGPSAAPAADFDPRTEISQLRSALEVQQARSALFERELQFRAAAAMQEAAAAQPQPQVDPILQEVLDILQVSEDDLIEVFQGGAKGAQIVTRALQATALLAVQAAERRLVQYYQRDQGARQQAQVIDQRAGQMHDAFWTNFPELAEHAVIVQHYAAQVAAEQAQAPRFDWESAQREVAARTVNHLAQVYNVRVALAQPTGYSGYAPPRPTLQSRLRPAFGEMGTGAARAGNPSSQTQLTAEILDLAR